jgi:hypothetical protein
MVRHCFLGFGSYVEPVQKVHSVFFLDLCQFLCRLQYLYYVEANQSGSSPESLERENTFCTITFQKCKKIKKFNLVSTLAQWDLSKNALKKTYFQLLGPTDFFPKRCGNLSGCFYHIDSQPLYLEEPNRLPSPTRINSSVCLYIPAD